MANQPLSVLVTTTNDTGYLDRVEMQIGATAMSIYLNPANTDTKKAYAKEVYIGRKARALEWAAAVRVNGDNITLATMDDAHIGSGVEVILNAFAPAEP